MVGMVFIGCLGWVLAAFFGGLLLNARGSQRKEKKKGVGEAAKSGKAKEEILEEQRRRAEQSLRQWQNFLAYDGTQQSGR